MPPWHPIFRSCRYHSSRASVALGELIRSPAYKYHIYLSESRDPFLNLSIEQYFLENSHKDSTVLFLYTNSPCVVIGRNQNPWLEVNLRSLNQNAISGGRQEQEKESSGPTVQLVRRRSGGGTVFHDEGNINYSVICPPAAFTRDKHAEMVVRAMRKFNPRARVNERHDIVLDQGALQEVDTTSDPSSAYVTKYTSQSKTPLKVSGSAYKLTRNRSLHHGTCLLASPNLEKISEYLHSPGRPYMKAKGVESVRSPVGNVLDNRSQGHLKPFEMEVVREFAKMYNIRSGIIAPLQKQQGVRGIQVCGDCSYGLLGNGSMSEADPEVAKMKVCIQKSSTNVCANINLTLDLSLLNGYLGKPHILRSRVMQSKVLWRILLLYRTSGLQLYVLLL